MEMPLGKISLQSFEFDQADDTAQDRIRKAPLETLLTKTARYSLKFYFRSYRELNSTLH